MQVHHFLAAYNQLARGQTNEADNTTRLVTPGCRLSKPEKPA